MNTCACITSPQTQFENENKYKKMYSLSFFYTSFFSFSSCVHIFACHQKTIKYAIAYMSRTQIEFITRNAKIIIWHVSRVIWTNNKYFFLNLSTSSSYFYTHWKTEVLPFLSNSSLCLILLVKISSYEIVEEQKNHIFYSNMCLMYAMTTIK